MLEENGYPFKSKEYSHKLAALKNGNTAPSIKKYFQLDEFKNYTSRFIAPKALKYQLNENFNIKINDKCCYKLKKEPAAKWAKENNKNITLTGMRQAEGGQRTSLTCTVFTEGKLRKFHPLAPLEEKFIEWFIKEYNIKLCELYYPPFNFERTGCKGCPYAQDLQNELETMAYYLPEERKQCEYIWKPIYKEYRAIKYRLNDEQPTLF